MVLSRQETSRVHLSVPVHLPSAYKYWKSRKKQIHVYAMYLSKSFSYNTQESSSNHIAYRDAISPFLRHFLHLDKSIVSSISN